MNPNASVALGPVPGVSFPHRVVAARRRAELKAEVERAHSRGTLSDLIFTSYTRIFDCPLPDDCAGARSLIVGALAHPPSTATFTLRGARVRVTIPPSYVRYWELTRKAEGELNRLLAPLGHWARFARVPQKLLAVRSGLARYGRNNVTFVEGLGSYHMLVSYHSSLPPDGETWQKPRLLERCERCTACRRRCPTGAIAADRFEIRQERCLTFYSGYSGPQELPDWLDRAWVERLIGCMRCQAVCPENLPYRAQTGEDWVFDEDETAALAAGPGAGPLPAPLARRLDAMGLPEFFGERECLEMPASRLAIFASRLPQA